MLLYIIPYIFKKCCIKMENDEKMCFFIMIDDESTWLVILRPKIPRNQRKELWGGREKCFWHFWFFRFEGIFEISSLMTMELKKCVFLGVFRRRDTSILFLAFDCVILMEIIAKKPLMRKMWVNVLNFESLVHDCTTRAAEWHLKCNSVPVGFSWDSFIVCLCLETVLRLHSARKWGQNVGWWKTLQNSDGIDGDKLALWSCSCAIVISHV